MNVELRKQFNKLEKLTAELIGAIENTTTAQLHQSPPGKWSLSQVFAHLITAEQLSVQYLKKKIQVIEEQPNTGLAEALRQPNTGLAEALKMWVLILSQRLPLKFKAPKVVVDHTAAYADVAEILTAWSKTRMELKELLDRISDDQLKRKIYKHPVVGKLNMVQTVRFFREHIIHCAFSENTLSTTHHK